MRAKAPSTGPTQGTWDGETGSELRLELLRRFELLAQRAPVQVPESAQRLLVLLALQDHAVSRIQIAGLLWPETSDARAAANLRTSLWRIRMLGLSLVEVQGARLRLAPAVTVDVRELVRAGERLFDRGDLLDAGELDDLAGRSKSWGELLPEWFDDWVIVERERLRQIRLHALESLCAMLSAAGRHGRAIEVGTAAVAEEPLRESAQRTLIAAHLGEGNATEAIRQFESYRRLLWDELGMMPSTSLEELVPPLRLG